MSRAPTRLRRPEAGFTMMELMISVVLAALATGFALSIYSRASQSSRAQSRVAETQQTLRAASQVLSRELRNAGMYGRRISTGYGGGAPQTFRAFSVINSATGPDQFRIVYADASSRVQVEPSPGPSFMSAETNVTDLTGWAVGDIAMAVRLDDPGAGDACILAITGVQDTGGTFKLQHNPAGGAPWNQPTNDQCASLDASGQWNDGRTMMTKVVIRGYRIKPADARGILQMSPSGGLGNDWIDMAAGIIDMQLAVRIHQPGDATDLDGDGNPEFDWYSGATMAAALDNVAWTAVQARISLLAKTLAPVNGVKLDKTPDLVNSAMPIANNDVGDRPGTVLPVASPASPYYGDNIYRWSSTIVDLRNLGAGVQQ